MPTTRGRGQPMRAAEKQPDTYDGRLGARIRARRIQRGQTILQAARAAGITPASWTNYELGRRPVRSETLARIAAALGTAAGKLVE